MSAQRLAGLPSPNVVARCSPLMARVLLFEGRCPPLFSSRLPNIAIGLLSSTYPPIPGVRPPLPSPYSLNRGTRPPLPNRRTTSRPNSRAAPRPRGPHAAVRPRACVHRDHDAIPPPRPRARQAFAPRVPRALIHDTLSTRRHSIRPCAPAPVRSAPSNRRTHPHPLHSRA